MSTLADFASLSLTELTAEIAAMQATFTPATASPSRDALSIPPPGLAVAGTFSTVTRSGQVAPSPADPAARDAFLELPA